MQGRTKPQVKELLLIQHSTTDPILPPLQLQHRGITMRPGRTGSV